MMICVGDRQLAITTIAPPMRPTTRAGNLILRTEADTRRSCYNAGRMATPNGLPVAGDVVGGKYVLVRELGEGGMSVVWEARHKRLHQRVAIKILRPEYAGDADVGRRFEREGRIAAQLPTTNIAKVFDVDAMPNGVLYMVMELLQGRDLETELGVRGLLAIEEAADIVRQAASAMMEAHAHGIVHRDLKPSNLFLVPLPASSRKLVKVLDFGIARLVDPHKGRKLTGGSVILGTALYMSPEQVRGVRHIDGRSDVWALGVILYELLTGVPPFDGAQSEVFVKIATEEVVRPRQIRGEIPPELEAVILRALKKDPIDRYASMTSLCDALAPFAPQDDIEAFVPPPTPRTMQLSREDTTLGHPLPRRRGKLIAAAVFTGVALVGVAFLGLRDREPAAPEPAQSTVSVMVAPVTAPAAVPAADAPPQPSAIAPHPSRPVTVKAVKPRATATAAAPPPSATTAGRNPPRL
jgi:eukaryotic-like serine/threonine-protein kinase